MVSKIIQLQHLYRRAGFDVHPSRVFQDKNKTIKEVVGNLFEDSENYSDLKFIPNPINGKRKKVSKFKILKSVLRSHKDTQLLNLQWINKMKSDKEQVREKMTFFWHDHFACGGFFAYLLQKQNNTIREHALGNFRELLHAMAKDPAMILYLNNQENKKRSPNENFAREVMELFTLGIGNYSENDIKEAARAFTGWQVDFSANYYFNEKQHDFGTKMFRNKLGNFNGEDILDMLLDDQQTSYYVCSKIYREFVNENLNEQHVNELNNVFYNSDYDISKMLLHLFNSDWFYSSENIGTKFISPVELLVKYQRLFNATFNEDRFVLASQKLMGQTLFMPPNVAGWKGGRDWIDSNTLLFRMRLPLIIFKDYAFEYEIKPALESADSNMINSKKSRYEKLEINADWNTYYNLFSKFKENDLADKVVEIFISAPEQTINKNLLSEYSKAPNNNDNIKNLIIHVMSLPEFQLI